MRSVGLWSTWPLAALPSLRPSHQQRKGDPRSDLSYMKGQRKLAFCDLQPMEGGLLDHVFYDLADLEKFRCEEVSLFPVLHICFNLLST